MKLLRRHLPTLDWGAKHTGKAFDGLTAANILGQRAGKNVLGGAL